MLVAEKFQIHALLKKTHFSTHMTSGQNYLLEAFYFFTED